MFHSDEQTGIATGTVLTSKRGAARLRKESERKRDGSAEP
jgi:hypothetical protein